MTSKTKKITLLTAGIAGTLLASSVAAVSLSACKLQLVNPNGTPSTDNQLSPGPQYNLEIDWANNTPADEWVMGEPLPVSRLVIDDQGLVYANSAKTELIGTVPNFSRPEITIPASVKLISGYVNVVKTTTGGNTTTTKTHTPAFKDIAALRTVKFAGGSQLKTIGANVFQNASNLETVQLPSSVTVINTSAFEGTTNLTNINLDNVQVIGDSAFKNSFASNNSLNTSINIKSAISIGASAFENVSNLQAINFSTSQNLIRIGNLAFKGATLTKTFDLTAAKNLVAIGDSAFENTTGVDTIKLPANLRTIGTSIFKNSSIVSMDFTKTLVTAIPASAFENALNLSDVKLHDQTTTLGARAFSLTPSLSSIKLPDSVSEISTAFANCSIQAFDLSNTQITSLVNQAFDRSFAIQKVILNNKITSIGEQAFRENIALTTLGILDNIIDDSISLPSTVTSIGNYAFEATKFKIADFSKTQLTEFKSDIFLKSESITSIKYPATLTSITNDIQYGSSLINVESIDLSETKVTSLGDNSFKDLTKLTDIKLPSTLTTIGASAFQNTALPSIELPEGVTSIGASAFQDMKSLKTITTKAVETPAPSTKAGLAATLPSTLTTLGANAFRGSALESIDLSNTKITEIKNYTFGDCEDLTTVYLPENVTTLGARIFASDDAKYGNGKLNISSPKLTTFGTKADLGADSTKATTNKVILPKSITKITNNAFEYSGIKDIDLSKINSFNNTGNDANKYGLSALLFNGATQLQTIVLPNWVRGTIPSSTFQDTKALTSVTVGAFPTTYADDTTPTQAGTFDISGSNIIGFAANSNSQFKGSNLGTFKFPVNFDRTSIPASAFENTKISEVKVQNPSSSDDVDKFHILGPNTTTISANAFSNNPLLKTIELPSSLQASPINTAFNNIGENASVSYPNGLIVPSNTSTTSDNAFANDPYLKALDLSISPDLTTLAQGTFNGTSQLNKLTLPASAVQWKLNATNNGNNPLYNNAKELNIEFTMFSQSNGNPPSQFSEIDDTIKQQIANIMNMFSRYTPTNDIHPVQYSEWSAGTSTTPNTGQNFWISTDLDKTNVLNGWLKTGGSNQENLTDQIQTATKNHNGVTWTYNKATSKTAGDITITSSTQTYINMYRTINTSTENSQTSQWNTTDSKFQPNQGYQTYFSTPATSSTGAPDPTVKVTVTMKIVTKA